MFLVRFLKVYLVPIKSSIVKLKNIKIIMNTKNVIWSYKSQKINSFYIDLNKLDLEGFQSLFLNNFEFGNTYSMLIRGEFNQGSEYRMLGTQIGFILTQDNYLITINSLYDKFMSRLDEFLENYKIDELDSVQVLFVKVKSLPKLQLKNLKDVNFPKETVNVKDIKSKYNSNFLPLTVNIDYFGRLITGSECKDYIDLILNQYNIISEDKEFNFVFDTMHLYKDKYIILSTNLDDVTIKREIYDANLGVFEAKFLDIIIDKDTFERKYKSTTFTISKDKLVNMSIDKELSIINSNSIDHLSKKQGIVSKPFIGSFDLEAFEDSDGYAKVYAVGFCVLNKKSIKFYLDNNDEDILLKCINTMLNKEYNGYTFYIHNLNYDGVFILNKLKLYNESKNEEYYKVNTVYKDSNILKIDVSIKYDNVIYNLVNKINSLSLKINKDMLDFINISDDKYNLLIPPITNDKIKTSVSKDIKISFVDSANLLKGKLANLCESFGLDVKKGYFPYTFVNRDTLHYIGDTPSYDYWVNLPKDEYKNLMKSNWNLKDECLSYLDKDLISLLELMNLFNKYIYQKFGLQVTDNLTISRLSINIFKKNFLKDSSIPIVKGKLYDDIKKSYYGGVTEVYKPYGENLFYYDVNSLYPFVALNPMCGNKYSYIDNFNNTLNLKDLFGFFYCEIETDSNYLGLLPVRRPEGLVMPLGKWNGWYFSEELKFASDNGYKIKVIRGYNFNKEYNVFDDYINYLYDIKSTTTNLVERAIMKSLLNNLLGRFGLNINKPITELVNLDDFDLLISTKECKSFKKVSDNSYLVSYYPKISKTVCEMHGLDYTEVLKNANLKVHLDNQSKSAHFNDVSIVISAAITAYARIYMNRIKLDILSKGGSIYYTDTDSIVTNIPLDNVGNNIGEFKLEYEIVKGYFISAKTYGLILKNNKLKTLCKSKGVIENSLTIEDCENLYNGLNIKAPKLSAVRNYEKGSVLIKGESIKLNHDSYKKRIKIYDEKSKWVDTRPLTIEYENISKNNISTNIISKNNILSEPPNKSKYLKVFSILKWGLYNIVYMLISLLFVGLLGDLFELNSSTPKLNTPNSNISNKLETQTIDSINKGKPLILNYLNNKSDKQLVNLNTNSIYLEYVYKSLIHELISNCITDTKFSSVYSIKDHSKKYLLNEIDNGRIRLTTSEFFEIMNKIHNLKNYNPELYKMLYYTDKTTSIVKSPNYNIVSRKWSTDYQYWIQNPFEQDELRNVEIKNRLSLLEELEKINVNYTYILNEYSNIKNEIDSKSIPRSTTNNIFIDTNKSLNSNNEKIKT